MLLTGSKHSIYNVNHSSIGKKKATISPSGDLFPVIIQHLQWKQNGEKLAKP